MFENLLLYVLCMPLLFAALALFVPGAQARVIALIGSLVSLGLSVALFFAFDPSPTAPEFQFEHARTWIAPLGIGFHIGADGLSVTMILLTAVLMPIAILSTWRSVRTRIKELAIALLVLQTAMVGTFVALDLALFYVFWEALLVPMYLLIGVWGSDNRIFAAVKFFIYTFAASVLMLIAIIAVSLHATPGHQSFDYPTLVNALNNGTSTLTLEVKRWLFLAFALAFAVKVPLFPLHTWLPDAHTEAPAAGSILLAGVLLKMGVFGFIRFAIPMFPEAAVHFRPLLMTLAVIGIVYGSLMSLAQKDMKRLIAYSSVAHMGFVVLGLFALGAAAATGASYQMVNHGISTGALFLLIGILYERTHTREIADYGGIAKVVPRFAAVFLVILLSSIGLPGTNGFVGEFLILLGTFLSPRLPAMGAPAVAVQLMAVIAATGVVLGAVYMLRLYQRVMLGPVSHAENRALKDLTPREWVMIVPLVLIAVGMGLFPQPFLRRLEPAAQRMVARASPESATPPRPRPGAGLRQLFEDLRGIEPVGLPLPLPPQERGH